MAKNVKNYQGALVSAAFPGFIASEAGIEPGDRILSINGEELHDIIDYRWLTDGEEMELLVEKPGGEQWILELEKDYQEPLGLEFEPVTIDEVKKCANNCLFCFVGQNPPGMRDTITFRDDDYRLSFLEGNYITTNNLTDVDMEKIINNRLSPLYVSIHTTNPELRAKMMGNDQAPFIMDRLKTMTGYHIHIHGQIVLCPGWNDGEELNRTLNDLTALGPNLASLSVVPVGLTAYRQSLTPITAFDRIAARRVISQLTPFREKMLRERGTRLVFPADEFYLMAGIPVPPDEEYEDYPQLSNGVGLVRIFLDDFAAWQETCDGFTFPEKVAVTIATGEAAAELLRPVCSELERKFPKLSVKLLVVPAKYFGGRVTVAGLLTGRDLLEALVGEKAGNIDRKMGGGNTELIIFPRVMLDDEGAVFLDAMTPADISRRVGVKLKAAEDIDELADIIIRLGKKNDRNEA